MTSAALAQICGFLGHQESIFQRDRAIVVKEQRPLSNGTPFLSLNLFETVQPGPSRCIERKMLHTSLLACLDVAQQVAQPLDRGKKHVGNRLHC